MNEDSIEELSKEHFTKEISLLCTLQGIKTLSALFIPAETGNDMSVFPNANSLVGWAGLRPGNDESAGRIQSRKTLHGNRYLRQILVEISWSAARFQKSFPGKKYNALVKRMKS